MPQVLLLLFALLVGILPKAFAAESGPVPATSWVFPGSARNVWMTNPNVVLKGSWGNLSATTPVRWTQTEGPAPSTMESPNTSETRVTFTAPGMYEFRFAAGDVADRLTVSVYDATKDFRPKDKDGKAPKEDFGYSDEMLQKYFTMDYGHAINAEGLDRTHVRPVPPPGVHPRILLNPEELPDLRRRLRTTVNGRILDAMMREKMAGLFGPQGELRDLYARLAAGAWELLQDETIPRDFIYTKSKTYQRSQLYSACAYMAFLATLDEDQEAGKRAAAAITSFARYTDWLPTKASIGAGGKEGDTGLASLGYAYDFAYNFMTEEQRSVCRTTLANVQKNTIFFGLRYLPVKCDSNWAGNNSMYALVNSVAFEGEPGFDPAYYLAVKHTIESFLTSAFFKEGGSFEGFGKAFLKSEVYLILAKRERLLIATDRVRNLFERWAMQLLETDGEGFTWDEFLAGHHGRLPYADTPAMFWAYPGNSTLNFLQRWDSRGGPDPKTGQWRDLQRNGIVDAQGKVRVHWPGMRLQFHYTNMDTLVNAIVVQDPDTSKPYGDHLKAVGQSQPLASLVQQRGLFVARSGWDTQALRLLFQPRTAMGRGSNYDRGFFLISALGRIWIPYSGDMDRGGSERRASVIRVDGLGPSNHEARLVDYRTSDLLSLCTGDLQRSYAFKSTDNKAKGRPPTGCYNDFYLTRLPFPPLDLPINDLPFWMSGRCRSVDNPAMVEDHCPMERAFRTAALVRGTTPYALIADDFRKDATAHEFLWNLPIAQDLNAIVDGDDLILADPVSPNRLLVRRLASAEGAAWKVTTFSYNDQFNRDKAKPKVVPMVELTVTAVEPKFRVLIVPFTEGTAKPVTTWTGDGVEIRMADGQRDSVAFPARPDGSSAVTVERRSGK